VFLRVGDFAACYIRAHSVVRQFTTSCHGECRYLLKSRDLFLCCGNNEVFPERFNSRIDARLKVFTVVKIQVGFFWVVMLCGVVVR
jgi:hypothetical protein